MSGGNASQGEEGFRLWKDAVGLPDQFPRLAPITEPLVQSGSRPLDGPAFNLNPHLFLGAQREGTVQRIVDSLGMPLLAVCVAAGHGCTTLAGIVYARAEAAAVGKGVVPVRVALEDYLAPDPEDVYPVSVEGLSPSQRRTITANRQAIAEHAFAPLEDRDPMELIYEAIRRAVLVSLTTNPWERSLGRAEYGTLIGAKRQDDDALVAQRNRLAPIVANDPISDGVLGELAPNLAVDVRELVRALNADRRTVRISLQLDLSSSCRGRIHGREGEELLDPYVRVVRSFVQALKNLDEQNARAKPPTLPSLLDQTVFISPVGLDIFTNEWTRQPEVVSFPWYRPVDLFAILAHHYPPQHAAPGVRPTDRLSSIMHSGPLIEVDQTMAITTAIDRLEARLRMQMSDPDRLSYHVEAATAPPRALSVRLTHLEERINRLDARLGMDPLEDDNS